MTTEEGKVATASLCLRRPLEYLETGANRAINDGEWTGMDISRQIMQATYFSSSTSFAPKVSISLTLDLLTHRLERRASLLKRVRRRGRDCRGTVRAARAPT